ncbi:MAG: methionyl-tRNA formyltransferase [Christensenellaceae bacterium]|nr:methionyl-tRNA formyltransferase [Christensenellaceae bacterium]
MKVVFMGTPDFAVPCLETLTQSRHKVIAVVTQPDRPRNRGQVTFCPVKERALELGILVLQYEKVSREGVDDIRALNPDVIVTAAFGQMLSREFLEIAPYGVINVHASLLPKYRGSSPIQWAVVNGETETGITIMKTAYKMDSGDIITQKEVAIGEDETAGELFEKLSHAGAPELVKALDLLEDGKATFTPQDESKATYFPMLKKEDGEVDFSLPAHDVVCRIRGFNPWPSAFTSAGGKRIKIFKAAVVEGKGKPGEVIAAERDGITVACGDNAVKITELQPENGKKMSARDYLAGHKITVGTVFGNV